MIKNFAVLLVLIHFAMPVTAQKPPQVKVTEGVLEGVVLPSGINSYYGIPYAQPPVGPLRWTAPQPPKNWKGVRKANTFGNYAMQKNIFGDMKFRSNTMSEDCLYLNVWTPAKKSTEKLPVLVYFYGGGFVAGDGSESRYDGESLATKGIVTVTLNYRLGIFGFFAHPELSKESPSHVSGNYGLLDQNAALLWVKKNIAAFGGDPNNITIAGESAGSISVSAHMASPLSKNLISKAIGQSGAMIEPTFNAIPMAEGEKAGMMLLDQVGINSVEQLRKMPADKLLELAAGEKNLFNTKAVIDGYFLSDYPSAIFEAGEQAQVPLLVGWTSAEVPYAAFMKGQMPTPQNYKKQISMTYGDKGDELLSLYPGNDEKEVITSATALASDTFIVYSTWKWATIHVKKHPVYVYSFSKPRPAMRPEFKNAKPGLAGGITKSNDKKTEEKKMPEPMVGAAHASDIEYALGNLNTNHVYAWTDEDRKVSDIMQIYLANFIKTGNPNGDSMQQWPVSHPGSDLLIMDINLKSNVVKQRDTRRYIFLDNYFKSKDF